MKKEIIKKAQSLCRKYETADPFRLCKEKDILVIDKEMPPQLKGLTVTRKRISFIYINSSLFLHDKERAFICGHELGHIFLGHNDNVFFTKNNTLQIQDKKENEADLFSASLLLERFGREDLSCMSLDQLKAITGINRWIIKEYIENI